MQMNVFFYYNLAGSSKSSARNKKGRLYLIKLLNMHLKVIEIIFI